MNLTDAPDAYYSAKGGFFLVTRRSLRALAGGEQCPKTGVICLGRSTSPPMASEAMVRELFLFPSRRHRSQLPRHPSCNLRFDQPRQPQWQLPRLRPIRASGRWLRPSLPPPCNSLPAAGRRSAGTCASSGSPSAKPAPSLMARGAFSAGASLLPKPGCRMKSARRANGRRDSMQKQSPPCRYNTNFKQPSQ